MLTVLPISCWDIKAPNSKEAVKRAEDLMAVGGLGKVEQITVTF